MAGKRSKRSRLRGKRTCGWGARKARRGKGHRGGKGMAGTGKRAGQRRTWVLRYRPGYFGKKGFTSLKQKRQKKEKAINLSQISEQLESFLKKDIAKKSAKGIELNLIGYKVLSYGKLKEPIIIRANAFSKAAAQKIKEAGGEAIKL